MCLDMTSRVSLEYSHLLCKLHQSSPFCLHHACDFHARALYVLSDLLQFYMLHVSLTGRPDIDVVPRRYRDFEALLTDVSTPLNAIIVILNLTRQCN